MTKYLLLAASLALASCAAQKALPQYTEAEQAAQRGGISYWQPDPTPADSTPLLHRPPLWSPKDSLLWAQHKQAHQVDSSSKGLSSLTSPVDKPTWLRRLFPVKQKPVSDISVGNMPRKCKGCTFNVVAGNQTVAGKKAQVAAGDGATASVIGKKAGPAQVASDSSTQNALLGGGNLAAVQGDGNTLPQTKQDTTVEAPGVGATIAKALTGPLGYVLAAAAVGGLLFLFIRRRAKNAAETLV